MSLGLCPVIVGKARLKGSVLGLGFRVGGVRVLRFAFWEANA